MKKVLVTTAIVGLILACAGKASSSGTNNEQQAVDGKKIYQINCVICHGVYGNMGSSGAFDLSKSTLTKAERVEVVTNGRKVMMGFKGSLSKKEIKAVAAYTMTLNDK